MGIYDFQFHGTTKGGLRILYIHMEALTLLREGLPCRGGIVSLTGYRIEFIATIGQRQLLSLVKLTGNHSIDVFGGRIVLQYWNACAVGIDNAQAHIIGRIL